MANPFEVKVPSIFEALLAGDKGYDAGRQMRSDRGVDDAGSALSKGNYSAAAQALFKAGKLEAGISLLKMAQEQQGSADIQSGLSNLYGPKRSPIQELMRPQASAPTAPNKVYANDEPSPLDPPSGRERDAVVRTVIAESGNQSPLGQQAVAETIRARAVNGGFGGDTAGGVVASPNQFEPWNTAGGRAKMASYDSNSPSYRAASEAVDRAYFGDSVTGGATHFYAPKAQAALGRPAPRWDNGTGVDIGDHRFFGGAGKPAVTAGQTAQAPADTSTEFSARDRPATGASTEKAQALMLMLSKPGISANQKDLVKMLLAEEIKINPEIQKLEAFRKDPGLMQLAIELKKAGSTNVTVDNRAENEEAKAIGKAAGERAAETMKAAGSAPRIMQNLGRMENLLGQVSQGKVEPARMTIAAWAQSFGLDDKVAERLGLDPKAVGTQQAIQALSNELTIGNLGAGGFPSNNFSNADRDFLTGTVPQLANTPEGNAIMIEARRRLAAMDMEKGREWQQFRAANKGKSFDDFETSWNDKIAARNIFADLAAKARETVQNSPAAQRAAPTPTSGQTQGGVQWRVVP
jgi:spore germination cell wall hydrolase CwlJ-like protein